MSEQFLAAIIQILVGLGSVLGAVAVYIRSRAKLQEIKDDRQQTKQLRDKEIQDLQVQVAVLKAENTEIKKQLDAVNAETRKRLDDGDSRFVRMDGEFKEMNKSLGTIIGRLDVIVSMKNRSHTPEERHL